MNYQKQIIKDTEKLRPESKYPIYPPYHKGLYVEDYFFNYFIKNKIKTDRIYIPIFWTTCYNNEWFLKIKSPDIQSYLNTLDPNLKYFTICQHEKAPEENLPKNTLIFSASGKIFEKNKSNNIISIPLICSKIKNPILNKKRDIFCSFVGANTHRIRIKLRDKLKSKSDSKYYFNMSDWEMCISKPKEEEFKNITERSTFTLCPRGDGPTSFRLYEAMQLGSIPVYVYDTKWLPYEKDIDWLDICVFVHEGEISHIDDILENISKEKISLMRLKIDEYYDEWFSLEGMCNKIVDKLQNEKMRLLTFYSDSHKILFENYFKPSVERINEYDIISEKFNQIGLTGAYFENGWKESMLEKLKFLVKTLNECWGDYFVFADADIIFFDKTKDFLLENIKGDDYDAAFQNDKNGICAGFFIMRCDKKSLKFLNYCIETYNNYPRYDDQSVMRVHINNFLKYKLLPNEIFNIAMINGGKVWDGETNYKIPKNIKVFHANWSIGVKSKIDLFNYIIDNVSKNLEYLKIQNNCTFYHTFDNESIFIWTLKDGKSIGGKYLKIENKIENRERSDNMIKKVNVYFNYFKSKNDERSNEIKFCLNKLIENKKIDRIYLLCSDEYVEKLDDKIFKIDMFGIQPTFDDVFSIVNFNTNVNDLNILINSDCYINEKNVDLILNHMEKNDVYCLSRWNIVKMFPFKAEHYDINCSQDAWIFLGEIKKLDADFKMGVVGCDNAIAYEFEKAGYRILNPSKDVKVYHNHFTDIRTYGVSSEEKEKNRIRRPYKFINSSHLKEINNNIEKNELLENKFVTQKPTITIEKQTNPPAYSEQSLLNKSVDKVYCINMNKRPDKMNFMNNQFQKFNINFIRFEGIENKENPQLGCLRSHIGVLQDAIDNGWKRIAIFEDDALICSDFEHRFKYYLNSAPSDWDILYLGNNLLDCPRPKFIDRYIQKLIKNYGSFAMILNNKDGLFEKAIESSKYGTNSIDVVYNNLMSSINAYTFIPFLSKPNNPDDSDIHDKKKMAVIHNSVNKMYRDSVVIVESKKTIAPEYRPKSSRDMCNDYLRSEQPFQVFYNNALVFDSTTSNKSNLVFADNYFILFGRNYPYSGMRISKK